MTRTISLILLFAVIPSAAYARHAPLSIMTANGCPTTVSSSDRSCNPNKSDAPNVACRSNGAAVVFQSTGNAIEAIAQKQGSAGKLNCNPNGAKYNCVVNGKHGDQVRYSVKLQGCPVLDPTIIIK